jgi:presenilin-like A22 family membrane protease
MNDVRKKAIGVGEGIVLAGLLAVVAYGVLRLMFYFAPHLEDLGPVPWVAWLVVMVIPETLFVVFAVRLWQKKRFQAVGIVITAVVFAAHFAAHVVSHFNQ